MARLNSSVFAARKGATLNCGKCGEPISKGERYLWFAPGFRSAKKVRHTYHPPMPSEMDASAFSEVLAAQEQFAPDVSGLGIADGPDAVRDAITGAMQSVEDAVESVADQYEEAAESMGGAGEQFQEWADNLRSAITDFEPDSSDPDPCSEHDELTVGCAECEVNWVDWVEEQVDAADEAVQDVSRE